MYVEAYSTSALIRFCQNHPFSMSLLFQYEHDLHNNKGLSDTLRTEQDFALREKIANCF